MKTDLGEWVALGEVQQLTYRCERGHTKTCYGGYHGMPCEARLQLRHEHTLNGATCGKPMRKPTPPPGRTALEMSEQRGGK